MTSSDNVRLSLRTLDCETIGSIEFSSGETILSVALHILETNSLHTKVPLVVHNDKILAYDSTLANAEVQDGAEFQIVWPAEAKCAPEAKRSHTDTIPALPAMDEEELSAALAEVKGPAHKLDVAGCISVPRCLSTKLPTSLLELDIRQCRMNSKTMEALFKVLPKEVTVLRASRNAISEKALECLGSTDRHLRILDVGFCDLEEDWEPFAIAVLTSLVGPALEELGLGDIATTMLVSGVAPSCPNLKKLDISFSPDVNDAGQVWEALSGSCSELEEVEAKWIPCPPASLQKLVESCPRLRSMRLGQTSGEGLSALAKNQKGSLDFLEVCVGSTEDIKAAAQVDVQWLVLSSLPFQDDRDSSLFDSAEIAKALEASTASDIELGVAGIDEACLRAAGIRLRHVDGTSDEDGSVLLPALAAAASQCPNLLGFSVGFYEQLDPNDIAKVAACCPLLEEVRLNADGVGFQHEPIDAGVLALGRYCHRMQHLDLYDRRMKETCKTLANACSGWPMLAYLCAAGTGAGDNSSDSVNLDICLAEALAKHCPLLQELELDGSAAQSTSWYRAMSRACPRMTWDLDKTTEVKRNKPAKHYVQVASGMLFANGEYTGVKNITFLADGPAIPIASEVAMRLQMDELIAVSNIETNYNNGKPTIEITISVMRR